MRTCCQMRFIFDVFVADHSFVPLPSSFTRALWSMMQMQLATPFFFFFRFFSSSGRVLCTPEQHNAFACKRCFRRQFDKNWASRRVIACDLHTRCSQWLLDIVLISLKTSRFSLVQRFRFQHFAGSCQNRCLPIYFSCTVILTSQATSKCNAQNVTLSRSLIKFCCFFFFRRNDRHQMGGVDLARPRQACGGYVHGARTTYSCSADMSKAEIGSQAHLWTRMVFLPAGCLRGTLMSL